MVNKTNLPWVEKYRPSKIDDLVSHEEIIKTIGKFIDQGQVPHLLFYGPPGTGKTSTILACAKKLYTPQQLGTMVLELNASDDRGIGIVRGTILTFASTRTIFKSGFKLIILDEADAMTMDAQNALRRIIEKYTENVRFCIICNYLSKLTPALQSRCTRFRFGPLSIEQILPRLNFVIEEEKIKANDEGKKALIRLANGDMRKVLNVLQSTWLAYKDVTEDNVYACVGHPLKSDIETIVKSLLNDDFKTACEKLRAIKTLKGYALTDIITDVHAHIHRVEIPVANLINLVERLERIEYHLSTGCNETIQLTALVSAFYDTKNLDQGMVDD